MKKKIIWALFGKQWTSEKNNNIYNNRLISVDIHFRMCGCIHTLKSIRMSNPLTISLIRFCRCCCCRRCCMYSYFDCFGILMVWCWNISFVECRCFFSLKKCNAKKWAFSRITRLNRLQQQQQQKNTPSQIVFWNNYFFSSGKFKPITLENRLTFKLISWSLFFDGFLVFKFLVYFQINSQTSHKWIIIYFYSTFTMVYKSIPLYTQYPMWKFENCFLFLELRRTTQLINQIENKILRWWQFHKN